MMTRDQYVEICKRCKNREFDPQQGIVCGLTKRIADYENKCENFNLDESVKIETPVPEVIPAYQAVAGLAPDVKTILRGQQDLVFGIVGGLSAAIVGAVIWALITVTTKYQIGYMAIGVGLLAGFSVRYFGAGVDYVYGGIGAFFALLGCALGNLLSQVVFIADSESLGYFQTITLLNPDVIVSIFKESFAPMDVVFYGIAAYEGYKFAFRGITAELVAAISAGKVEPLPHANLRMPIVMGLFVVLSTGGYFIHRSASGIKTFYYESGAKHYEGTVDYGVEKGLWTYWWENGKVQQIGFFNNRQLDSLWQYFDEEGVLYRRGRFKQGIQTGRWEDLYPSGKISSAGSYHLNRKHGWWTWYFEDGTVSQRGYYNHDLADSTWEAFQENGKPTSRGSFRRDEQTGLWVYWLESGDKSLEIEYKANGYTRIVNAWDGKGIQQVKNGEGKYTTYHFDGKVSETGRVSGSEKVGVWKQYSDKGVLIEEGEYRQGVYHLLNSWSPGAKPMVVKGEGTHESYFEEEIAETGEIKGGLRTGEWKSFFGGTKEIWLLTNYVNGVQDGKRVSYFEGGKVNVEGVMKNNKQDGEWKWYFENGSVETTVTFVDGLKQGDQPFYDDSGKLLRTEIYRLGEMEDSR